MKIEIEMKSLKELWETTEHIEEAGHAPDKFHFSEEGYFICSGDKVKFGTHGKEVELEVYKAVAWLSGVRAYLERKENREANKCK